MGVPRYSNVKFYKVLSVCIEMETTNIDRVKAGKYFIYILHAVIITQKQVLAMAIRLSKLELLFVNKHLDPRSIQIHCLNVSNHGGSSGFLADVMMI
jgi:hypothetical protein